jgi:predicted nucleotidyltransferase
VFGAMLDRRPEELRYNRPSNRRIIRFSSGKTCKSRSQWNFRPVTDRIQKQFTAALDDLIAQVKQDRSILAAILCGSLAHDTVWMKSDIDLALVTVDDGKIKPTSLALYARGINVHAFLMPRADFRKTVEGAIRNSPFHSLLAKGRLLYTHDETILTLCARLRAIGERDTQLQILTAATRALPSMDKARKWFVTRGDLDYTALWILYAATPLAQIEVLGAGMLADREVIPQAMKLNPAFFGTIYANLLNARKTRTLVETALEAAETFLAKQAPKLFAPVIDYLRDVGEARSASEIEAHFKRNFNLDGLTTACEYLADLGLISKASIPVQLTKRSNISVEELAFAYTGESPHGW